VLCFGFLTCLQQIPDLISKQNGTKAIVELFFKPPVGALIAAMVSTFGAVLSIHLRARY
jgi:hypothetical protein